MFIPVRNPEISVSILQKQRESGSRNRRVGIVPAVMRINRGVGLAIVELDERRASIGIALACVRE